MNIQKAVKLVRTFKRDSLGERLSDFERVLQGRTFRFSKNLCKKYDINSELLIAVSTVKDSSSQIDIVIHAIGILAALPEILDSTEKIKYLSLGAGNTGKKFDLETDLRVAEFKFINWRGGSESIRQNSLFKDFYGLAEFQTKKRRCLYVLGTDKPLKFLNGRRKLSSVMSKNAALAQAFKKTYSNRFKYVSEYYKPRKNRVELIDLNSVIPELGKLYSE